jgi:hypothetical protein
VNWVRDFDQRWPSNSSMIDARQIIVKTRCPVRLLAELTIILAPLICDIVSNTDIGCTVAPACRCLSVGAWPLSLFPFHLPAASGKSLRSPRDRPALPLSPRVSYFQEFVVSPNAARRTRVAASLTLIPCFVCASDACKGWLLTIYLLQ